MYTEMMQNASDSTGNESASNAFNEHNKQWSQSNVLWPRHI